MVTATTILLGTITAIHNSDTIHLKKNLKNKPFLQKALGTVPVPQVGILIYLKVYVTRIEVGIAVYQTKALEKCFYRPS